MLIVYATLIMASYSMILNETQNRGMPPYVVYSTDFQTSLCIRIASPSTCPHPYPRNSDSEGLRQDPEVFIKIIKKITLGYSYGDGPYLEKHLSPT